jgi:EAL domain-containing protein (putative c-di-GMP-specific phosphodiesterase class I)
MIKIDRSFVAPFESGAERPRSSAVIEAILALGRALDMDIVAEGVETEAQRALLVSMGCAHGQGYLFGRPQPASHWTGA